MDRILKPQLDTLNKRGDGCIFGGRSRTLIGYS